jgi:hypothetical protein
MSDYSEAGYTPLHDPTPILKVVRSWGTGGHKSQVLQVDTVFMKGCNSSGSIYIDNEHLQVMQCKKLDTWKCLAITVTAAS